MLGRQREGLIADRRAIIDRRRAGETSCEALPADTAARDGDTALVRRSSERGPRRNRTACNAIEPGRGRNCSHA